MSRSLLFNLTALLALIPAALTHFFPRNRRDVVYWAVLGVAAAGSIAWAATLLADQWHTGFSVTLWVSIAASLVVFIVLSAISPQAWRLLPLLMPYLILLGIVATVWSRAPDQPLPDAASGWLGVHIFVSVLTYALLTIAAVAGRRVGEWHTGFSVTLWVSIAASLVVFIVLSAISPQAWRLLPLLMPYLILLGIVATVWSRAPDQPLPDAASGWLGVHIFVSVLTYALLTIAAVAGSSVLLQEWALKRKRPMSLTRALPSVTDGEELQLGLLTAGAVVLGAGLITGAATQYVESGTLMAFDHKTLLSVLAFVVIGVLLIAHRRTGVRGRRAARFVLLAYLLLTLAYPGVKFVTDVLMA